jgi:Ice-binding-like
LGGQTLVAGAYKSAAADDSFLVTSGILTLDAQGDPNAVWIFQMNGGSPTLTTAITGSIAFQNGLGDPCNVFWQVGSSATIGSGTTFIGNIMAGASITLNSGAIVNGRALASIGQVSLSNNTINGCSCPQ